MLIVVPNPIDNRTAKRGAKNHSSKEYAKSEWASIRQSESLDCQDQSWEDQGDCKGQNCQHNEIQLGLIFNKYEEEFGYRHETEADEQGELNSQFVYYEASYRKTVC